MKSTRCSNCSLINFVTESVCKRCGTALEFAAEQEWDSRPHSSSESHGRPLEGESPYWDQPSYTGGYSAQKAPSNSMAPKLVKALVVLAVASLVAFVAVPALLRLNKPDLADLTWNEYQSPDGKFSVSLPIVPKENSMSQSTPLGPLQVHVLTADVSKDGGCVLLYADYPVERINMSEETLYNQAIEGAIRRQNKLVIGARRYVTLDGFRGLEVELKPADPKLMMSALARVFWVAPRLYLVMGGGPDTAEYKALQNRCLDSFRLLKR